MKIKICGMKTLENCLAACEAGADMLGFNFYEPSPRYITRETCKQIVAEMKTTYPQLVCVGVFVNHSTEQIHEIIDCTGLDLAQLSGDEPLETLVALGDKAFKALRPHSAADLDSAIAALPVRRDAPTFLLDSHQKGVYGGTGQTGDWKLATEITKRYSILLAGGLNPDNVSEAIRIVRPWGVDVASGVESQRGVKDPKRVADFIQQARLATQETVTQ